MARFGRDRSGRDAVHRERVYDFDKVDISADEAGAMAVAGLICGIVGVFVLQFVLGPLAMIFGGIALKAGRGMDSTHRGLAIGAAALGAAAVVLFLIGLIVSLVLSRPIWHTG